ncbi:hypothetical protein LMJF_12_0170 [Leishmania major strain Friedlin]|uniref:Uncharacterized protein n=1 Tax=Leishmania major TaxID=5664 RepID=Q4QGS6_LEIMA|nr:hypothetical protein LMJF_12_0170 [Leishmania major strain Friedlin]CAG9570423.1 hypothetical_protein_-_conserved [Leishmania major strain Friedlin]CAJ02441.1 hypothetical protein LMJF_12_0170 [Leishmania major strain Friedlin]|eukprot:XP_001681622.1 hypothetical protein LMJF_12_0170 [Leishmania major strain Friedlin]
MYLHVMKVACTPDERHCENSVNPSSSSTLPSATTSSSCPVEHGVPDEESRFTRLYEAAVENESALRVGNYTRRLLFDEFCATSDATRQASQPTCRMLRQRHPALRSLSLSVEGMHSAGADRTSATQLPADSTMSAAESLQAYLSPALSAWRCASQEPFASSAQVAAAAPLPTSAVASDVRPRSPLPLHIDESDAPVDEGAHGEGLEALYMDVFDQEGPANNHEVAVNAAYTREREAADRAALLSAQQATMAGCPCGFTARGSTPSADVSLSNASSLLPEEDDISLVLQPVLGGVAQRRGRGIRVHLESEPSVTTSSSMVDASFLQAGRETTTLTCAVCELSGVVGDPHRTCIDAVELQEEDELHPCGTCGALVHSYCACPGTTADTHYCCNPCCPGGGTV